MGTSRRDGRCRVASRERDCVTRHEHSAGQLRQRWRAGFAQSGRYAVFDPVVSSDEAKDLMANTANDLFKYDPAVSAIADNSISENSMFTVRGLPVDTLNGIKVEGSRASRRGIPISRSSSSNG
jgi:hypothetical protein